VPEHLAVRRRSGANSAMSPYRSSTDQHDADTRTGMLGEFCGSHPQPPISASRPVTARLARCASCVFSSATGTPGRTSWFSPDWRSRPAIQSTSATRTATAPTRRRKSHCRASQAQDRQTRWRLVDPCHAAGLHAGVSVLGALINTALISLVVHAVRRRRSRA
jgi:hypothetical protein